MTRSHYGLDLHGLQAAGTEHWNLLGTELIEHAIRRGEGRLSAHGAFVAITTPASSHAATIAAASATESASGFSARRRRSPSSGRS